MSEPNYSKLSDDLVASLGLQNEPLAITFSQQPPAGVQPFDDPMPQATEDGRTGRVAAGCVFWMKAVERTFTTVPEDHANCSVGSVTHGFKRVEEVADKADIGALLGAGWVTQEMFPALPAVKRGYRYVTYGPLRATPLDPDVVFLRLNAKQAMKDGGEIRISTFLENDRVFIKIKDTGEGIPPQNLDKIFDPGFTTKGVGVGTGLGLSICFQIIQEHQGNILVESKPGAGTTFTIVLPTDLEARLEGNIG